MNKIPTQLENSTGLHQRYIIQKIRPNPTYVQGIDDPKNFKYFIEQPDKNAEYFVMRLDEGGKDVNHIKACRIGVNAYADAIAPFIPELAKDLKERYPIAESVPPVQDAVTIRQKFIEWCGSTKRTGSVLVNSSINEFFDWLEADHPSPEGKEAVEFAEWIGENYWIQDPFPRIGSEVKMWEVYNDGPEEDGGSDLKTTAELYLLFTQSKTKA